MPKSPKPADIYIGNMVRTLRLARGISQRTLAECLGVSYQQLQKYEKGRSRLPIVNLMRAARALNFPILAFLPDHPDESGKMH